MRKSARLPLSVQNVLASSVLGLPAPGKGKRGEDRHLAYLLRQASVTLRAHLERSLADLGVTQAQFAVLTMVAAYPGLSNADLARLSLLTPQTLSVTVSNLRRAGLLERQPHAVHGRIQTLCLTRKGEAQLGRCRSRVDAIERSLANELSKPEERAVRKWLAHVATTCTA